MLFAYISQQLFTIMGKSLFLLWVLLVGFCTVEAQEDRVAVGLEQDVLPYALGGYFANVWVGKEHFRARALMAKVNKPDFLIPSNFTNNRITAYALLGDYFFKNDWKGLWIGSGVVHWNSSIDNQAQTARDHFKHWLLNGSAGYNWQLAKHFYVGPWAGLHLRVHGTGTTIGSEKYQLPLLNPEASIKIGWYFYP